VYVVHLGVLLSLAVLFQTETDEAPTHAGGLRNLISKEVRLIATPSLNHSKPLISSRISLCSHVVRGLRLHPMKALQAQAKSAQAKDTNLPFNLPSNPHADKPAITSVI
jgi:hypothetical protein